MNRMLYFQRIAKDLDINPFLAEIDAVPEMWLKDTSRQRKVRCQRHTQSIYLRSPKKPLPPGEKNANNVHSSRLTSAAKMFPRTLAFCESVATALNGSLGRVTLVTLLPQSKVYPHVDAGEYYRIRDRFHLVLRSSLGSPLAVESETVVMRPGEFWVFNNKFRHWAENQSNEPRVHLIFDVRPAQNLSFYASPVSND